MNKNTQVGVVCIVLVVVAIAVVVLRAHAPQQSAPVPVVSTVLYSCNAGKTITAAYRQGESTPAPSPDQSPVPGGSVALTLSDGRSMTLSQTVSADGTRYANPDESFVFWGKGNGALVLENNEEKLYTGCMVVAPEPAGSNLSQIYSNGALGFSLRYPVGYTVDESYAYQELGPGKDISGVKFIIPKSLATGTNLGSDSYLSVEKIPKVSDCTASLFVSDGTAAKTAIDAGTTYSVATSNGAGAGNRYDETVYAIPGTNPCMAIRYFVHYSVIENYPAGTVKEFDEQAITAHFDQIRRTLTVNQ